MASSLLDPAGPIARPEILPPVDDRALSVKPEEFLQLLADFARQARPHSAAVRQLQRAEVPLGAAGDVAPRGRQIVVVADRVFGRAVRVQNGFFRLSNRHKSSVEMIYNKRKKKEKLVKHFPFFFIGLENNFEGSRKRADQFDCWININAGLFGRAHVSIILQN